VKIRMGSLGQFDSQMRLIEKRSNRSLFVMEDGVLGESSFLTILLERFMAQSFPC
jgi:hypothetical protein